MVKYPLWILAKIHYTIQHEGGRHIDFRQMSINIDFSSLVHIRQNEADYG